MANFHNQIKCFKPGGALRKCRYLTRDGWRDCPKAHELQLCQVKNLPACAQTPAEFFRAADQHERKNGAACRELEISLPRELPFEKNVELGTRIADKILGPRPRLLAFHESTNRDTGEVNPHVHVIYSDRPCDGIPRSLDQYFKRANPISPADGGARKLSGGKTPGEMGAEARAMRQTVAELTNDALTENGHEARVDHRSHEERGLKVEPRKFQPPALLRSPRSKSR